MFLKNFFSSINIFLIPLIIIIINNPLLIDVYTIINFSIFPIILGSIIFFIDYFLFKKNYLIIITGFIFLSNLLINIIYFKSSLVGIKIFLILNFFLFLFFLFFLLFYKKKINFNFINFFTILLIIICISNYFIKTKNQNTKKNIFVSANLNFIKLKNKPDIFHIIPDGLLNISDMEKYGYDKSNNLKKTLRDLNLEYYENSLTNYPATFFSLASTLNGSIIKENLIFQEKQIYKTLYNSSLHDLLMKNGYKIFWYQTKWLGSKCNSKKYICMNNNFYESEIFKYYLQSVNVNQNWINKILYKTFQKKTYTHLDNIGNDIEKIYKTKKPKYIYGYINLPHGPYTVDNNCTPIFQKKISKNIIFKKKQYFEQVECFEKQLKNFIDVVKKKYKEKNFLVIVQSDTGWSFNSNLIEEGRPHPDFPDRLWPKTYFNNFIAVSKNFSCINKKEKISNADLFPILISCLNNTKLNLKNHNKYDVYYSNHPKHGKIYLREDLE